MLPVSFVGMVSLYFKNKNFDGNRNFEEKTKKYEFILCLFLVFATQASGQPTFLYYAKSAFPDDSTIITFGLVKFLSTLFCSGIVDKLGRKTMPVIGCLVMTG